MELIFKDFVEEKRLKHTLQGLNRLKGGVPRFLEYLKEAGIPLASIGVKEAQAFQGWLLSRKYKNLTVITLLNCASVFCGYLKTKGIIPVNPFLEIRRIRREMRLPRNILKEEQMEQFLETLTRFDAEGDFKHKKTAYRVHVIAELMYSTGMRVSEVAGLKVEDIDFDKGLVSVNAAKGGESRIAYLNDYAKAVLKLYVENVRDLLFSEWNERNSGLLFGVQWGWFGKVLNTHLAQTARQLQLGQFTSHGFRHAVGYHLLRSGCNIRHIQQILGHKRLKDTEIYTKVDREDLKTVLDACHPRKWRKGQDEQADS